MSKFAVLWTENVQIWGLVNWKYPNLKSCELKVSKFSGLRAKILAKIWVVHVEAKIWYFFSKGVLWTDYCLKWDPYELRVAQMGPLQTTGEARTTGRSNGTHGNYGRGAKRGSRFLWGHELLGGKQQIDAQDFKKSCHAIYTPSTHNTIQFAQHKLLAIKTCSISNVWQITSSNIASKCSYAQYLDRGGGEWPRKGVGVQPWRTPFHAPPLVPMGPIWATRNSKGSHFKQ